MKRRFGQINGRAAFADIAEARLTRRGVLGAGLALAAAGALGRPPGATEPPAFDFQPIRHGIDANHHVAPGHDARVLMRWGDGVTAGAPPFDAHNQSAAAQAAQFGYNNDFIGYLPLLLGSDS